MICAVYKYTFIHWNLTGIGKLLSEGINFGSQISSKEHIVLLMVTMHELCSFFQVKETVPVIKMLLLSQNFISSELCSSDGNILSHIFKLMLLLFLPCCYCRDWMAP